MFSIEITRLFLASISSSGALEKNVISPLVVDTTLSWAQVLKTPIPISRLSNSAILFMMNYFNTDKTQKLGQLLLDTLKLGQLG
jgi:hypothetical protein